jgi:hypothetical protein
VRAKIGKLAGLVVALAISGLSLYLWIEILGGFSFSRGLKVLGLIFVVVIIVALPRHPAWSKTAKISVLAAGVVWIIRDMLPIETPAAWVFSVFIAAVCCLIGYIVLFENFFS